MGIVNAVQSIIHPYLFINLFIYLFIYACLYNTV